MRTHPITFTGLAAASLVFGCTPSKGTVTASPAMPSACCRTTVYEVPEIEQPPSFPGGDPAMFAWLGNNSPELPPGTEGTSWVQFNIECDGSLTNVVVKRGADERLDSAALALVNRMPSWSPGLIKNQPVCVQYILPIKYPMR